MGNISFMIFFIIKKHENSEQHCQVISFMKYGIFKTQKFTLESFS